MQVSGTIITGAPIANAIGGNVAANYDYHMYHEERFVGYAFRDGAKPGIAHDYKNGTAKVDKEWLIKGCSNMYMSWGLGFAIGAL